MQKESKRTRQFGQLSDHFAPKRQPLSLLRVYAADRIDKREYPGVLRRDPTVVKYKKKGKKKRKCYMARGGRTSLSKPCSRIMPRTHCSNYSCIRLTPLSAEPAGRGTCVTNVRARPRHRRFCLYAYVLVCVRVCVCVHA